MSAAAAQRRAVVVAALGATYLQAVMTSIPNAAVFHIGGALSMTDDEIGWIFSAYIAGSAIVMPMTRWLAGRYGRKTVFQTSLAAFAIGLLLATQATAILQFVAARFIQGAASGTLAPLSLAILLDGEPAERQVRIGLLATVTLMCGILSGPPLGGWLGEYHGWRSIFDLGALASGAIALVLGGCLTERKAEHNAPFDFLGLATFSMGFVGLQMVLDRGERMEWFCSTEIWIEAIASALGFWVFAVHVLTAKTHFLSKALFRDRNFMLSAAMFFAFGFVLLPTVALTSPMLEELLGYPADTTGYMTIPRSLALLLALVFAARPPVWAGNRLLLIAGSGLVVYGNWRMAAYSPLMDWQAVLMAGVVQGAGLGLLMPTLSRTAFATLDPALRPEGTALFNLLRLYGSTIGIAVVQLYLFDNTQALHLALAKDVTPLRIAQVSRAFAAPGVAALNDMVTGQASAVALFGQFKLLMFVTLSASPLALLLRKPKALAVHQGAVK